MSDSIWDYWFDYDHGSARKNRSISDALDLQNELERERAARLSDRRDRLEERKRFQEDLERERELRSTIQEALDEAELEIRFLHSFLQSKNLAEEYQKWGPEKMTD